MAIVRPFTALRPAPARAAEVAAVPYDVVTTDEARRLAAGNPFSFLHVSRPEIDLPDGTDPYSPEVYEKAAASFQDLKKDSPLTREAEPRLYVYCLRMDGHEQTGVAGCCSIEDYDQDLIRKHERTRKDKEDDRTRHMISLRAQTGPVFLTYRDLARIDEMVAGARQGQPLYDFAAPDGIQHTIWRLSPEDSARLEDAFRSVPLLYIADGHHRAASASRARAELRDRAQAGAERGEFDFFLSVVFPAGQLRILPYNRTVKDLNGRSPEEFVSELKRTFSVVENSSPAPTRKGDVGFYIAGRWYGMRLAADPNAIGPISSLDVSLLQERVLQPLLGIRDVRTDKRIDFIGGIRGTRELERLVDSGRAAMAFSMYPVSIQDLMRISDANEIMPPKSTWFEPKLRDGLLIHEI